MDFDALRAGMAAAVPFNQHLGLEVTELGPGTAKVRLPDEAGLRNHVGTQHAAGLFAAAEAASGPIDATATLDGGDDLIATLDADGKVSFPVEVRLTNADGDEVATASVQWHVRRSS